MATIPASSFVGTLRHALTFVGADKLYPAATCGMAPLARDVAQAS